MPGGWTRITGDRHCVGAVNFLVALAGDEKSDAGADDDIFDKQRALAAGARIRELSKGLTLGGLTIRELIDEGRQ